MGTGLGVHCRTPSVRGREQGKPCGREWGSRPRRRADACRAVSVSDRQPWGRCNRFCELLAAAGRRGRLWSLPTVVPLNVSGKRPCRSGCVPSPQRPSQRHSVCAQSHGRWDTVLAGARGPAAAVSALRTCPSAGPVRVAAPCRYRRRSGTFAAAHTDQNSPLHVTRVLGNASKPPLR